MNLSVANLKGRQIPHLEIAKRSLLRIAAKLRGDRAEKLHLAVFAANPARMIHMRGQRPIRGPSPAASLIPRNNVPKVVLLEPYVRNFAQLRLDLRPHRVLMKGSGRLIRQRRHDGEHLFLAHLA